MMNIKYTTGDLLKSSHKLLLHGCNSRGRMGSGIAKVIREVYPEAYAAYRQQFLDHGLDLGTVVYAKITESEHELYIANCITQEFYGSNGVYIDYEAINNVMVNVNKFAREHDINEVAMPLIGAGLGGGSWKRISRIIEDQIIDVCPIVYTLDGVIPNN